MRHVFIRKKQYFRLVDAFTRVHEDFQYERNMYTCQ